MDRIQKLRRLLQRLAFIDVGLVALSVPVRREVSVDLALTKRAKCASGQLWVTIGRRVWGHDGAAGMAVLR